MKAPTQRKTSRFKARSVTPPRNTVVITGKRDSKSTDKGTDSKKKEPKVRGAEVSIRQSASPGQIIYGRMRVGGVFTFLRTNRENKAYTRTGADNNQIVWIAKAAGATGNNISVTIVVSATAATTTVTVVGQAISVRAKSTASVSEATANDVIAAIRASGAANALVEVHEGEGTGASNVQAVAETFLQEGGGTRLHAIITLAAHEINEVERLYLDNKLVTFGATPDERWSTGYFRRKRENGTYQALVFMTKRLGTDNQTAIGDFIAQLPTRWTSDHRQRGCAHVGIILVWDEVKFAQGLPAISFLVKGKPLYDPRTATTVYSTNAALVIADYLTNTKFGMGVSWSDIDTTALQEAANDCDELVTLADATTERRYQIKGSFDTSAPPQSILQEMADAIAGDIVYQGGKWRILPGKWRAPTISLSRDDVRGSIRVTTRRGRAKTFNCVRGTYSSEKHEWEEVEFPTIKVSSYITEDGREIYEDLPLNFVTTSTQAQRIARIRLAQNRQMLTVECSFTIKALRLEVGEVIQYTDSTYGWTNKYFEVRDFALEHDDSYGILCKVVLVETAEAIYTWTVGDELAMDPAPDTGFPDFDNIEAPTGLTLESGTSHLYVREDGTVFTRLKVSWTGSENPYVQQGGGYQIQYKQTIATTWTALTPVSADNSWIYVLDVKDAVSYDVRIRAVSSAGVVSEWTTASGHVVIGKTAPPSDVTGLGSTVDATGVRLAWSAVSDVDVREYEIRYGTTAQAWSAIAATAVRVRSTNWVFPTFASGTYRFHVRAIDTTGNYSTNSATTDLTINAPSTVQNYTIVQVDNNILVDWDAPSATTFPVDHYKVYKGATFGGATLIGKVGGTFYTYIEKLGGLFTYWVTAVDAAGNEGAQVGQQITVYNPPDYIIVDYRNLSAASATRSQMTAEADGSLLGAINTTETFEQHFTNNAQTTIQGFISAGFTHWPQPTPLTAATADWNFDLGAILPQNLITVSYSTTQVAGTSTISPTIYYKTNVGDPWTAGPAGASQVYATNFRYVRVVLSATGGDNKALASITNVFVKTDTKKQTDSGTGTANSGDAGGTTVSFNLDFLDVTSIVVTPQGTSAIIPVVDFTDAPNPTTFKVLLFNTAGTRVSGDFRWTAEGVITVI